MDHAQKVRELKAQIARLEAEVDRAWQQVRQLKAREDMRHIDLAFSDTSRELLKRVEDALADLEFTATPLQAKPTTGALVDQGGGKRVMVSLPTRQGKLSETPIPGEVTRKDRARLEVMQNKLRRILAWYEQTQQDDLLDTKKVYIPRPRCSVCGTRGQVGWTDCPKGHGPYEQKEPE